MVFFFFGGASTQYKLLEHQYGPCPSSWCKTTGNMVDLVESGYKFNAFFLPLPGTYMSKQAVLCQQCGYTSNLDTYQHHKSACLPASGTKSSMQSSRSRPSTVPISYCSKCSTKQQSDWTFCPHCGCETNVQ